MRASVIAALIALVPSLSAAEDVYCTVTPNGDDVPVADTVFLRVGPGRQVLVMDTLMAAFTDMAIPGRLVRRDAAALVVGWTVPLVFRDGQSEDMRTVLHWDRGSGKVTVTASFTHAQNRFWGRGRCVSE